MRKVRKSKQSVTTTAKTEEARPLVEAPPSFREEDPVPPPSNQQTANHGRGGVFRSIGGGRRVKL